MEADDQGHVAPEGELSAGPKATPLQLQRVLARRCQAEDEEGNEADSLASKSSTLLKQRHYAASRC